MSVSVLYAFDNRNILFRWEWTTHDGGALQQMENNYILINEIYFERLFDGICAHWYGKLKIKGKKLKTLKRFHS